MVFLYRLCCVGMYCLFSTYALWLDVMVESKVNTEKGAVLPYTY